MNINIFTEDPEKELWQNLLQYSYKSNIKRYFIDNNIKIVEDESNDDYFEKISSAIAGAISQADEYYKSSKLASLHIAPLLLYYGTTNLLYAMSLLLTGKSIIINNHGMRIIVDSDIKKISDTQIKFTNVKDGGIHIFAKKLGFEKNICEYTCLGPDGSDYWLLKHFVDSIAEISNDYTKCYISNDSHIVLLHSVNTSNGLVEKIYFEDEKEIVKALNNIEGFSKAYLTPQSINNNGEKYLILHHKINGENIQRVSYSGQSYLQVGHLVSGKIVTFPEELNMYISLFILGNLCRYYPEIWYSFVTQDTTGEKLLMEKLLYYSRRILPNVILNKIEKNEITFVSDRYSPEEKIHYVGDHEVKELIKGEVKKELHDIQINKIVKGR